MAKSIRDSTKSRPKIGRPKTTGSGEPQIRMHGQQLAAIDAWIATLGEQISRPEAIRRLVEIGLSVKAKSKQPPVEGAKRARELAGKAIEKMSDPAASMEERTQRRRRLTRGPAGVS